MDLSAYQHGEWVAREALQVDVEDVGFLMGVTVTERLRTFGGALFRLDAHLDRMEQSLEIVGLPGQPIRDELAEAIEGCLVRNAKSHAQAGDWSVVAFVTPGLSGGCGPRVTVYLQGLPFARWAHQYEEGEHVCIGRVRQVPTNCWPAELKCRSRMHYYLADVEAAKTHPGTRAILLDQEGYVGEATTANVIVLTRDGHLITPPRDRVLPGVTLAACEELTSELGVTLQESLFEPNVLREAQEVLLVSTSICVVPVVSCDRQPIGDGRPGAFYRSLVERWKTLVNFDFVAQAQQSERAAFERQSQQSQQTQHHRGQ